MSPPLFMISGTLIDSLISFGDGCFCTSSTILAPLLSLLLVEAGTMGGFPDGFAPALLLPLAYEVWLEVMEEEPCLDVWTDEVLEAWVPDVVFSSLPWASGSLS